MGGLGAMLFGFLIVYDTQLIFGNSQYSGGERQIQYTIDLSAARGTRKSYCCALSRDVGGGQDVRYRVLTRSQVGLQCGHEDH